MTLRVARGWAPVCVLLSGAAALASGNPFLGKWNVTGQGESRYVCWLGVTEEGGRPSALFLNRGGSPVPVENLAITGDTLSFSMPARAGVPGPRVRLRAAGGRLSGTIDTARETVDLTGVRPPQWRNRNANARHRYGKPIALFDGRSLDGWDVQKKDKPVMWGVEQGILANEPHGNNLVSKQRFRDFKLQAEYRVEQGSNSGIYLRGRYELQILDDAGKEPESHGHMAIYARKPPDRNASRPPGEWQSMETTLVGNRVTVVLNGTRVHDNAVIEGITGGALDADELEPGPIMIQGDHQRVWFRKITLTPILDGRK